MSEGARALRIQLMIGFMCAALLVYFALLGRTALLLVESGEPAAIGLGAAIVIMPIIGIWVMVATLKAGLAHQRLGRLAREQGMELDVGQLPRRRSGRIERDAADALFATVRDELSRPTRTTGYVGTAWPGPTITPATAAGPGRP